MVISARLWNLPRLFVFFASRPRYNLPQILCKIWGKLAYLARPLGDLARGFSFLRLPSLLFFSSSERHNK
jgi:hypothetical protein